MSTIVPVYRIPSITWDLWPHRHDDWFINSWDNWLTDWDSVFDRMNEDFRIKNNFFQRQFSQNDPNANNNEQLPNKIGWRLVENTGEEENRKLLQLDMPIKNFTPEEVSVQVKDGVLNIEAKHQHEKDGRKVYRETKRRFTLPQHVKEDDLKCHINPDGILTVNAPAPKEILEKPVEELEKLVPIEIKKL